MDDVTSSVPRTKDGQRGPLDSNQGYGRVMEKLAEMAAGHLDQGIAANTPVGVV